MEKNFMRKKIRLRINYEVFFLFFLLFVSIGGGVYFISSILQPMRIWIPICVFFFLYKIKNSVVEKEEKIYIFVFLFYYLYTLIVSIINYNFNDNDLLNFTMMLFVVCIFFYFVGIDKNSMLQILIKFINIFFFIATLVALYEIKTRKHLAISHVNDWPDWINFMPSTFYANPNDFVCVFFLFHYIKISVKKDYFKVKKSFDDILTFILLVIFSIVVGARLVLISIILFEFIYISEKKPLCMFLLVGCIISYIFITGIDIKLSSIIAEEFNNHGSNEIRKNLYIQAIHSLTRYDNYYGYGINQSCAYFLRELDPELYTGIIRAPHGYVFEILLNSGPLFFSLLILFQILQTYIFFKKKMYHCSAYSGSFLIVLFTSATSLYLWPHYLCSCALLCCLNKKKLHNMQE